VASFFDDHIFISVPLRLKGPWRTPGWDIVLKKWWGKREEGSEVYIEPLDGVVIFLKTVEKLRGVD
jgi:hypothetical protein